MTRRLRRKGGALVIIAALLVGSGVVRLATEAGPAFARGADMVSDQAMPVADMAASREELHAMLTAFQAREAKIAAKERDLENRTYALDLKDAAITSKLEALIEAETALRETLALADGAVAKDVDRLTTVYETMKPKEAAALFEAMAPEFAAGFLARMRPDAAAEIMTGLSPDAAYTISVVLAGRHATVPED